MAAQALSCGYYLFFFTPAMAVYIAWEATVRRRRTDRRTMLMLAASVVAVAAIVLPFLIPYGELRRLGFVPRPLAEVQKYSADVYAWFTADPQLLLWRGVVNAWPRAEGALFPGLTIALLAGVGVLSTGTPASGGADSRILRVLFIASAGVTIALLLGFQLRVPRQHPVVRVAGLGRALAITIAVAAAWLARSPGPRRVAAAWARSDAAPFTAIALVAIVMSFGPVVYARGRIVAAEGPYRVFYDAVPGVDGLRVPARFAMVGAFALAVLAGIGLARIAQAHTRRARLLAAAATVLICAESFAAPLPINQNDTAYRRHDFAPLPGRVEPGLTDPVYRFIAAQPSNQAVVELPIGEPAFDVRYMFHAIWHQHPLVNGYSGGAPPEYELLAERLNDLPARSAEAWRALRQTGASFAIVHEASYAGEKGRAVSSALAAAGGEELAVFETDKIFRIQ